MNEWLKEYLRNIAIISFWFGWGAIFVLGFIGFLIWASQYVSPAVLVAGTLVISILVWAIPEKKEEGGENEVSSSLHS